MKKGNIISDQEMREAITYLRKHSVKGKLGVILWTEKGWRSPSYLQAIVVQIGWFIDKIVFPKRNKK